MLTCKTNDDNLVLLKNSFKINFQVWLLLISSKGWLKQKGILLKTITFHIIYHHNANNN